jgi:hypothetical protein
LVFAAASTTPYSQIVFSTPAASRVTAGMIHKEWRGTCYARLSGRPCRCKLLLHTSASRGDWARSVLLKDTRTGDSIDADSHLCDGCVVAWDGGWLQERILKGAVGRCRSKAGPAGHAQRGIAKHSGQERQAWHARHLHTHH